MFDRTDLSFKVQSEAMGLDDPKSQINTFVSLSDFVGEMNNQQSE